MAAAASSLPVVVAVAVFAACRPSAVAAVVASAVDSPPAMIVVAAFAGCSYARV